MRLVARVSKRLSVAFLLAAILGAPAAGAEETCGLQEVNFDSIHIDGFDPPPVGGGLGPPAGTVPLPALGVAPTVAITWPTPGAVLPGERVRVVGTVSGPVNTGVSVAGQRAYVHDGVFLLPELNLEEGALTLTATATTLDGLSASADVAVTLTVTEPEATPSTATPVGFSPLPVRFRLKLKPGLALESVEVDFDGDGSSDYTGSAAGDLPLFTYPAPGAYTASASLTFSSHAPVTVTQHVLVLSLPEQRSAICATYAHLRARLLAQDANGASQALMGALDARLRPLFNALGPRMAEVAPNLGTLADGLIGLDAADIIAVRDLSSEVRGYPVHFARDAKGVWRIDSM